ncbi:hypothetical protein J4E85_008044 [Alternaria conjuncta]|uniref:uncharacterized protein n=1 Tax=Alternaria conjuncta TaxID=181017 RepID=UPI0022205D56|nr:uncharacterized protein J4E85_008044 [Alternaria conjuncta]KAI4923887.1 hypothetical protein J4E85_008044 [Alternaria conjuncta]
MSSRYILPVEPADGRGETVVIEVLQQGSHPLDVRLVGCEGETPYVASITHRNLASLKHKFKGSDDEWAAVVSHFLLQQQPEIGQTDILDGVRMVYTLKNKNLELSFRQDVGNIKVTLGEIVLPEDDEFEFNPFEWAQASAMAHAKTLQQVVNLKDQVKSEQHTLAKLNAQLDDFIKTKNDTETAMLQQFMQLLNEKKRKIRDQSRLLAGVKVDKPTAAAVQSTRADTKTRKPGASRTSKRKAPAQAVEPEATPDADSDQMEIDLAKVEEQDDEEMPEPMTPEQSDNETDEEDEPAPRPRGRSSETLRASSVAQSSKSEATQSKGVPPPRALPFQKRMTRSKDVLKQPSPAAATAADDDDDDDETDDEEL